MQYFYSIDGTAQQGPVSREGLLAAGVGRDAMVWREGLAQWMRAGDLAELADLFGAGPTIPTPAVGPGTFTPQPPAQPQYETPYMNQAPTSGMAIASMVLGIVGLTCCTFGVVSLLAVIFGHLAKGEIRRTGRPGNGMATAGLVMGYIGLSLIILWLIFAMVQGTWHTTTFNSAPVTSPLVIPSR